MADDVAVLRAEVERLQELLQVEVRLRGVREQELQDARLHVAALEHRVLNSRQSFAELENTLLHDLQVQKRASLSELEVTRFLTTFRNAFHRQVELDEASVHSHRAAEARLAALQEKVDRLERTAEHERAASEEAQQDWRQQKAAMHEAHSHSLERLEAELLLVRRKLHGRSRQRLGDACQVIRERASLVRESMLNMRVVVEAFQRLVSEGMPQGAARRSIAAMSSSKSSSAIGRFRQAALRGVNDDRATVTSRSTNAVQFTREEALISSENDEQPAAAVSKNSAGTTLFAALPSGGVGGGLVGKMMKALESTKVEHEYLVQRERDLYECLRQLSEFMCSAGASGVLHRKPSEMEPVPQDGDAGVEEDSNALLVGSFTHPLPDYQNSRDVNIRQVGSALVSFVERRNVAWLTEKTNLVRQLRVAEETNTALKEVRAELAKRLSVYEDPEHRSDAHTQTDGAAYFSDALADCHHTVSVGVQCALGSLHSTASSSNSKARGPSRSATAKSERFQSANRIHNNEANASTSEDAAAPVELPPWTEAGMMSAAEAAHRRGVTKRCMIRWLRQFERRKRSSLETFLKTRVAPALGISSAVFPGRPHSSSPRRKTTVSMNDGAAEEFCADSGEKRRRSAEPNVTITSAITKPSAAATPRPPSAPRVVPVATGSHSVRTVRGERERCVTTLSYRSMSLDQRGDQ